MCSKTNTLGVKKILLIVLIAISIILSASCLLINFKVFEEKTIFYDYSSKNIFPDNNKLDNNIIIFKSNRNIANYKIKSSCNNNFNYL
jgi:hypothetical protein